MGRSTERLAQNAINGNGRAEANSEGALSLRAWAMPLHQFGQISGKKKGLTVTSRQPLEFAGIMGR